MKTHGCEALLRDSPTDTDYSREADPRDADAQVLLGYQEKN